MDEGIRKKLQKFLDVLGEPNEGGLTDCFVSMSQVWKGTEKTEYLLGDCSNSTFFDCEGTPIALLHSCTNDILDLEGEETGYAVGDQGKIYYFEKFKEI